MARPNTGPPKPWLPGKWDPKLALRGHYADFYLAKPQKHQCGTSDPHIASTHPYDEHRLRGTDACDYALGCVRLLTAVRAAAGDGAPETDRGGKGPEEAAQAPPAASRLWAVYLLRLMSRPDGASAGLVCGAVE